MIQNIDPAKVIYGVVRGERPYLDLASLGIEIEIVDGNWRISSPSLEPVEVAINDIAYGLIKFSASPMDLKNWANLILSGSSIIDLSKCEEQTGWDILLEALWDASANSSFTKIAFYRAQELAE